MFYLDDWAWSGSSVPMLFDLAVDRGEVSNIAREDPKTHGKMFKQMMSYLGQVGTRFPKENPDFDLELYRADPKTDRERLKWGAFEGKRPLEEDVSGRRVINHLIVIHG